MIIDLINANNSLTSEEIDARHEIENQRKYLKFINELTDLCAEYKIMPAVTSDFILQSYSESQMAVLRLKLITGIIK